MPDPMKGANLHLCGTMGEKFKVVGKVVPFNGALVYHYWAEPGDRRHDIQAWGMREAVCSYLDRLSVGDCYIYDKVADRTYATGLGELLAHSTPGLTDAYGGTLNLPMAFWQTTSGLISGIRFVPEPVFVDIHGYRRWELWRERHETHEVHVKPDVVQPGLFGD